MLFAVTDRLLLQLPTSVRRRCCETGAFNEVGEAGEATPDYRRPRWCVGPKIASTMKMASAYYLDSQAVSL